MQRIAQTSNNLYNTRAKVHWGANSLFNAALYSEWGNKKAYWNPFSLAGIFNEIIKTKITDFICLIEIKQIYEPW